MVFGDELLLNMTLENCKFDASLFFIFSYGVLSCCSVQMVIHYVLVASQGFTIGAPPAGMSLGTSDVLL